LEQGGYKWFSLGVLGIKSQIPITKFQLNLKCEYSMTKTFLDEIMFEYSNFGHWDLFDIWYLEFQSYNELSTTQNPSMYNQSLVFWEKIFI